MRSSLAAAAIAAGMLCASAPTNAATVLFTGNFQNVDAPSDGTGRCGAPPNRTVNIGTGPGATAVGTSNLGNFTSIQSHCVVLPLPGTYKQGIFEFTFDQGDQLTGTYFGELTGAFPTFTNNQTLLITGGSGRFFDASGTVSLTGTVTLGAQARASGTFQGLLNLPAVPEPSTWAMMIIGFGMLGGAMRSARQVPRITTRLRLT